MLNCKTILNLYQTLLTAKHLFDASLTSAKIKKVNPNAKSGSQPDRWDKQSITQATQAIQALETVYTSLLESTIYELIGYNFETAKRILGKDYLGPKALERTFGISLDTKDIPPIPFSYAELLRAKELGQFLILRPALAPDGAPLTMQKTNELLKDRFEQEEKGKILLSVDWYSTEEFYTTDSTPSPKWAMVSKEVIPNSLNKNYLEQTRLLADYIQNQVFKNQPLPQEYQQAIEEFETYHKTHFQGKTKEEITDLLNGGTTWHKYAENLSKLKINQLARQSPADFLFDELVYFDNTGERIFEKKYAWTKRRSSFGWLVVVGECVAGGARVDSWWPGDSHEDLGVSFSRSP